MSIKIIKNKVYHESSGGFLFFEDPKNHELFVALLTTRDDAVMIPKGHVEKSERPIDAAYREIKEELNIKEDFSLVDKLKVDNYSFKLDDDNRDHEKRVHLYVFEAKEKFLIAPQKEEGFVEAIWFKFEEAKEKITFDLDNLLAARQIFYEKRAEKRLKKKDNLKSLSICLPTHNGEQTISRTLKSIKGSIDNIDQDIKTNILICLDHCTDSTEEELRKFKKNLNINIVKNEGQKGKAEALNLLFERSPKDSDAFVFIDDDVELDKNCLNLMIKELNKGSNQFVFAEWKRKVYIKRNAYRKFWYKVFGVKFDIQIYRKKSQLMRGACMMCQREDFVRLPGHIINDDQFFQYIYWPNTKEVAGAVTYFDSVDNCRDYRNRFLRIGQGMRQLDNEFAKERLEKCKSDLFLSVDKDKIKRLDFKTKILFKIYRVIRYFVKIWVDIKLRNGKDHGWYRTRKN